MSKVESALSNLSQPKKCWLEAGDGQRLFYAAWEGTPGEPVVVYLHGIEGHSGWFARTALHLNERGISIYAPDRRGSGENSTDRGHVSSYKQLLADLNALIELVRRKHLDCPLFLVGNCWGAKLAVVAAVQFADAQDSFDGLILTSPAIETKVDVSLWKKMLIAASLICCSKKHFAIPVSLEMFTDNPVFKDYIQADGLRLTEATAAFFVESTKLTWLAQSYARRLTVPLLIVQAGKDQIVSVKGIKGWFDRVVSQDKILHILKDDFHSLDFAAKNEEYLAYLSNWIQNHSTRSRL